MPIHSRIGILRGPGSILAKVRRIWPLSGPRNDFNPGPKGGGDAKRTSRLLRAE